MRLEHVHIVCLAVNLTNLGYCIYARWWLREWWVVASLLVPVIMCEIAWICVAL